MGCDEKVHSTVLQRIIVNVSASVLQKYQLLPVTMIHSLYLEEFSLHLARIIGAIIFSLAPFSRHRHSRLSEWKVDSVFTLTKHLFS